MALSHRPGLWCVLPQLGQMTDSWTPTPESLEKLLTWLTSNREDGADRYEKIRKRLIKYFVCNGCGDDDEHLTDQTIDRVMKRLDLGEIPNPFTGDKALYFLAFARNIRLEHFSQQKKRAIPPPVIDPDRVQAEAEAACLEECVRLLGQKDCGLAVEYYHFDRTTRVEHHSNLAIESDLSLPGLRTRIRRIRERLRPCIEECLERRSQ